MTCVWKQSVEESTGAKEHVEALEQSLAAVLAS